jgi:hypothetical protein
VIGPRLSGRWSCGVRRKERNPPYGELSLTYVGPDAVEQPLSGPGPDPDELHSLWSAEVFPFTDALPG